MILKYITMIKKKPPNKINHYNFYHGTFNFRKNEITNNSQQTDTYYKSYNRRQYTN